MSFISTGISSVYSVDAGCVRSILGCAVYFLALGLCLLEPFSSYRVYDVKDTQLVSSRSLLEVRVDFFE